MLIFEREYVRACVCVCIRALLLYPMNQVSVVRARLRRSSLRFHSEYEFSLHPVLSFQFRSAVCVNGKK